LIESVKAATAERRASERSTDAVTIRRARYSSAALATVCTVLRGAVRTSSAWLAGD